jgi:tetratricopeptide (TPR) repeat protein
MCNSRTLNSVTILTLLALLTIPLLAASCAGRSAAGTGDDYFRQGLYDLAVEQYRLALAEKPDSAEYREKLDLAAGRAADYHFKRGRKLLTENRLKDAAAAFDAAVEYQTDYSEAKEAYDAAIQLLTQLTLDIENGRKFLAEKKWFDAIERLEKVRNYPADFPEAEAAYNEAVDGAFNSLMSEGIEAYREERFDEALGIFTRARQLKPKDAGAAKMIDSTRRYIRAIENYRTGEALLKGGDFRRAIAEFQTSLLLVPGYAKASDGLARAKRRGAEILFREGRAALKEKRFATAVAALNEAAGYAPDMKGLTEDARKARRSLAEQLYKRGRRYERTKSPALAYLCFRMAGKLDPGIAGLSDALSAAQTSISAYRSYAVFLARDDKDENLGRRVLTGGPDKAQPRPRAGRSAYHISGRNVYHPPHAPGAAKVGALSCGHANRRGALLHRQTAAPLASPRAASPLPGRL